MPPEIKEGEWIQRREHEPVNDLQERERRMLAQGEACRADQNRLNALAFQSIKDADARAHAILERMRTPPNHFAPDGKFDKRPEKYGEGR